MVVYSSSLKVSKLIYFEPFLSSMFCGKATWHQFDGVSYIYSEKGWWETFKGWFRSEETVKNSTTALLAYLPKWKGFVVAEAGEKMKATDAIVELDEVVNCMTNVWTQHSHSYPEKNKPPDFNAYMVNCLENKRSIL